MTRAGRGAGEQTERCPSSTSAASIASVAGARGNVIRGHITNNTAGRPNHRHDQGRRGPPPDTACAIPSAGAIGLSQNTPPPPPSIRRGPTSPAKMAHPDHLLQHPRSLPWEFRGRRHVILVAGRLRACYKKPAISVCNCGRRGGHQNVIEPKNGPGGRESRGSSGGGTGGIVMRIVDLACSRRGFPHRSSGDRSGAYKPEGPSLDHWIRLPSTSPSMAFQEGLSWRAGAEAGRGTRLRLGHRKTRTKCSCIYGGEPVAAQQNARNPVRPADNLVSLAKGPRPLLHCVWQPGFPLHSTHKTNGAPSKTVQELGGPITSPSSTKKGEGHYRSRHATPKPVVNSSSGTAK